MTRIALAGFMHESNTFAEGRTGLEEFEAGSLVEGRAFRDRWADAAHEVAGFRDGLLAADAEPVDTLMAWATPAGPLTESSYRTISKRLDEAVDRAGPIDGLLLALHGSMTAEGIDDADGSTAARLRERIGPDRPLVVSLDYHANVSPLLVSSANAVVGYQTYPHIDQRRRGRDAATIAVRAARGEIRPVTAIRQVPLLIHLLQQDSSREPIAGLLGEVASLRSDPKILDASLFAGFPYADGPHTGASVVVTADGDLAHAQDAADRMGERLWSLRESLSSSPAAPEAAVRQAIELRATAKPGPILLIDIGDNIGGGSAADSTVLANELQRQGAKSWLVVLFDPDAVALCDAAGVGAEVSLDAGGKIDRNASPLAVAGRVAHLHDGRYVETEARHGGVRHNDQGRTAVVETNDGATVVLTSLRHPPFSLGQITSLGLDPARFDFIVVKAAVAYKAAYQPIASAIVDVDSPGLTASNPTRFPYRRLRRPTYPLDPAMTWRPTDL